MHAQEHTVTYNGTIHELEVRGDCSCGWSTPWGIAKDVQAAGRRHIEESGVTDPNVQYRCFPCQAVFDTIPEWRAHMPTHGERILEAAGVTDPPTPEIRAEEDEDVVLQGVRYIIAQQYAIGYSLRLEVMAAIRARLAVDADPWWHMSDDRGTCPQAKLTERGIEVARERGYFQKCVDHVDNGGACRQELLSEKYGGKTDRCASCAASLSQFGPPGEDVPVPSYLCGMCTVSLMRRTDPTYILPKRTRY